VLKDINLTIKSGQIIGITGPVGSGKSTLLNLIPRVLDPPHGQLFIGGVDVRRMPLQQLRQMIGYVPQESFLFSQTIRENIAFGLAEDDLAQVIEAASISHIAGEVESFPGKYETVLGERGVTLSGGQRQRTALARALATNPQILILDDVFSNVDSAVESKIWRQLQSFLQGVTPFKGRTCLMVSQRVSTIMGADEIIVLRDGMIAERGTHQELLSLQGYYARLYQRQLLLKGITDWGK
jgi:ATP-binding cassette subfamily B protein